VPVSVLLCEGADNSPDIRLLAEILKGTGVVIEPSGGKDGFPNLVRSRRRVDPRLSGFVDGDFPRRPRDWVHDPDPAPPVWQSGDLVLGWRWKRKEVENYFIDPDIVARAFGWDGVRRDGYAAQLSGVLDALGHATAARMALTACAPRKKRVDTNVRLDASEEELREQLRRRVTEHNEGALLDGSLLLDTFAWCATECRPGGRFHAHALEVFAGKNILARIQNTAGFHADVKSRARLEEAVIDAMARDPSPHTWLPEWSALRSAVEIWEP
jgi:hypothetical protein